MVGNVAAIALSEAGRYSGCGRSARADGYDSAAEVHQEEEVVKPIGADNVFPDIRSSKSGEGPTISGGAKDPSTARNRA